MKPDDYKFDIGDRVVTVYGEVGRIVDICKCDKCVERGFFEPTWTEDGRHIRNYITIFDVERGLGEYRSIGKYRFNNPFAKGLVRRSIDGCEKDLAKWKKRLAVIEEMEKAEKEAM